MQFSLKKCRLCGENEFEEIIDLGNHSLSGVFPRSLDQQVSAGSLRLLRCCSALGCGLVQLEESFSAEEMYGDHYGYRSGLNSSMVRHLESKVRSIEEFMTIEDGDIVIDIGSNDGTTLASYSRGASLRRIGVDPSGEKFRSYYPKGSELIADFFSAETIQGRIGNQKAIVVTSFSMFYDLEDPLTFARDVSAVLQDGGAWIFEQSYLPAMLEANSYDTICHEHLEYYALKQILWILDRSAMTLQAIECNQINGGSFSVVAVKNAGMHSAVAMKMFQEETKLGLNSRLPYDLFAARVKMLRVELRAFLVAAIERGERVAGLGASTKGNTLLQYCDLGPELIECIGEVNSDKFGCVTPGTGIPIVPEDDVLSRDFDYLLVLPWHFREFFLNNPRFKGQRLLFPLPNLETLLC